MSPVAHERHAPSVVCDVCGIPLDAEFFDDSGFTTKPAPGETKVLARFELPPQYCGVLRYFAQFKDGDASVFETPTLRWMILSSGHPLYPYTGFDRIVNPWGEGSFPIAIRLDEGARIELVVRGVTAPAGSPVLDSITRVGGRIVGRYWYNQIYGGSGAHRA